jgi:hypothetical protein
MLFTQTREEYENDHAVNFTIAAMIFNEDQHHLQAFQDLYGEILNHLAPPASCTCTRINDNNEEQALWTQNDLHISTCSNHAERFHRTERRFKSSIMKSLRNTFT